MTARIASFRSSGRSVERALLTIVAALGCLSSASGQGRDEYFNVETPVGQAIAVARIANHDYLLVCNTPDNSVEVYDTDETQSLEDRFLARVPVGMEPNSILWDGSRSRVYVTCFLNDSVDSFVLSAPTGPGSFSYTLDRSRNVGHDPSLPGDSIGDEPMDLALTADKKVLLVSFGSRSVIGAFDPLTLAPVSSSAAFPAPTDNILLQATIANVSLALKEPRPIEVFGDQLFVLNHKGGTTLPNPFQDRDYDFDLYVRDVGSGPTAGTVVAHGNLGSSNWNMRFSSGGDLYVVSGLARIDLIGGPAVATAQTGFVKSMLYRVTNAGAPGAVVEERDLNLVGGMAVDKPDALAMPTDLVVREAVGVPTKVYVAAFGSDRVGVVTLVDPSDPATWTIARIPIPVAPNSTNPRSGPRALVLKTSIAAPSDPGERVYVLNRLDNSVSAINPQNNTVVQTFALDQDPTPAHIRIGREFLYSADLSLEGFVSCASCHGDGRTDALGWNLGSPTGFSAQFPRSFVDSPAGATLDEVQDHLVHGFSPNKGMMITQTLQGLLTTEVPQDIQDLVTAAPYHWRGDRALFTDFNEAFANLLLLGDNFGTGQPGDLPMGISAADMEKFEEFVNSIHYPPNPKQLETRVFSGSIGTNPDDQLDGTLALRGMKVFHIRPQAVSVNKRSCAHCHALPIGSNLKFTDSAGDADGLTTPLESSQLRGLFQREARHQVDGYDTGSSGPLTGMFGMAHLGGRITINNFIALFGMPSALHKDVNQFVHEFDWAVAPMVGRELRVTQTDAASAGTRIDAFESQVKLGNCGLAVNGVYGAGLIGYWYDPIQDLYVEEASAGANAIPRSALLGLLTAARHRLFFRCTPLGSERRIAAVDGSAEALDSPNDPSNLVLLPMAPNTAWAPVPTLDGNWIPVADGGDFDFTHGDPLMPTPRFPRAIRQFQYGLIDPANQFDYGLSALRHDAPRRFRVSGDDILPGAKLVLWTPRDTSGAAPDTANPPDPAKTRRIELALHATGQVNGESPIWETAVELAPIQYYALLNGGIEAPGVRATLEDAMSTLPEPAPSGTFNPDDFNWHYVEVINPDNGTGNGDWQQLKLQ